MADKAPVAASAPAYDPFERRERALTMAIQQWGGKPCDEVLKNAKLLLAFLCGEDK